MIDGWEKGWLKARRWTLKGREDVTAPCYQLVLCLGEGSSVAVSEGSAPFWPARALLLPPDRQAALESQSGTDYITARFDRAALMTSCLPALAGGSMLLDFFLREEQDEGHLPFLEVDYLTPEMISLMDLLVKLGEDAAPESLLVAQRALCELLCAITAHCYIHTAIAHDLCREQCQKISACMLRRRGRVSLDEVADHCYCHRNTVSRVIRRVTGVGFGDFCQLIRVNYAAQELRGGEVTVRRSAEECGYRNITNFYRQFREVYGVTPGEYQALFG